MFQIVGDEDSRVIYHMKSTNRKAEKGEMKTYFKIIKRAIGRRESLRKTRNVPVNSYTRFDGLVK
jgi:hypothetical protein